MIEAMLCLGKNNANRRPPSMVGTSNSNLLWYLLWLLVFLMITKVENIKTLDSKNSTMGSNIP